jgi:hypothetical protein
MKEVERTLHDVVEELEGRRPDLRVLPVRPDRVRLIDPVPDGISHEVSLKPVLAQIRLQPGRRAKLIAAFAITVSNAFEERRHPGTTLEASHLTALIRTDEQVSSLRAFLRHHDPGNDIISAPLAGPYNMVLAYNVKGAEPEALTLVLAKGLGLDEPALARRAFDNLRRRYRSVRRRPVEDMPNLMVTRAPMASSLLILADLFAPFTSETRVDLLVVAPARDFLLYADSYTNGVLYDLRVLAGNVQEFAPDPLSDEVLKWTPSGFETF